MRRPRATIPSRHAATVAGVISPHSRNSPSTAARYERLVDGEAIVCAPPIHRGDCMRWWARDVDDVDHRKLAAVHGG